MACDIRDPGAVAAAVTRAAGLLGGPADVLVNAAGVYRIAPLLDLTPGEWDECSRSTCAARSWPARLSPPR